MDITEEEIMEFQSLSRCEAAMKANDLSVFIGNKVTQAYERGYRDCNIMSIMTGMSVEEQLQHLLHSLNNLGIHFNDIESAAGYLARILRNAVLDEEKITEILANKKGV